ncbi:glutathione S-transferase N-terminal domain-containing protein [Candidatus Berkelbacteria bacterium]|nr:glutathione S-transferase N-terminal domain-containing protein [Candidatus Berkelbacteria bacterium]
MKHVTIYTTPTCIWCKRTKEFFKQHHVAYDEKDVSSDQALANEMIEKSGQMAVPVIDIDGEIVVGFDRLGLAKLLGLSV